MEVLILAFGMLLIAVTPPIEVNGMKCNAPTTLYDSSLSTAVEVIQGEAWAVACHAATPYTSTGTGRTYLAECRGKYWGPNAMVGCAATAVGNTISSMAPCTGQPTPMADSELLTTSISANNIDGTPEVQAHFLKCTGDKQWLSGASARMCSCRAGEWDDILDLCVDACTIPRDCSELAELGFSEDGVYKVITTGVSHHDGVEVYCWISNTTDIWTEGGWTVILRQGSGYIDMQNTADITQNGKFAIDLYHLKWLFQEKDGTPRPQTMQFLIEDDAGTSYHATYKHVLVSETGELLEVQEYMGDAGNAFVNNIAIPWDETVGWWFDSNNAAAINFGNTGITWPTLVGKTLVKGTIRIRPKAYDTATSCSPMVGVFEPSWLVDGDMMTTSGEIYTSRALESISVVKSRAKDTVISYSCRGDFFKEQITGNSSGTVTCVDSGDTANPYTWSSQIQLPCTARCPENFVMANDGVSCYRFSTEPEPHGVVGAAVKCMQMNATLAFIRNSSDVTKNGADGTYYYTTHSMPSTSTADIHADVTAFCDSETGAVCAEAIDTECAAFSKDNFKYQSCNDATSHFVCMWPIYCPGNFTEFRGGCFQAVKDFGTTPIEALTKCNTLGGALAVPPDLDTLQYFDELVKTLQSGALPTNAIIGLNNAVNEDFTQGGIYAVNSDVTTMATSSGSHNHFAINVSATATSSAALASIPLDTDDLTTAVCQFPGLKSCLTSPPEQTVNNSRLWDNATAINSVVTYQCYPGYFVQGNISVVNQTLTCYGQLGEWQFTPLDECYEINVCNDTTLPEYEAHVVTMGDNHMHLNGTVTYACPANMGAFVNSTTVTSQVSTCGDTGNATEQYAFDPMPTACNVCIAEPVLTIATSDWVNTTVYYVNDTITATCNEGHLSALLNDTQILTCTEQGWEAADVCYKACTTAPDEAGSNMTRANFTANSIGSTLAYSCEPEYYFPPTPDYPDISGSVVLTCDDTNSTWEPADRNMTACAKLCHGNPQGPPTDGNTTWDGASRVTGTQVTLSCPTDMLMGDGNATKVITCEDTGNWTQDNPDLLVCRKQVTEPLPELPDGMSVEGFPAGGLTWEGMSVNYTCPNNTMSSDGRVYVSLLFNGSAWVGLDPTFQCLNTCSVDPMYPSGKVGYNYTNVPVKGAVVAYYCQMGRFIDTRPYYYSVCDGETWNLTVLPMCERKLWFRVTKIIR